MLAATSLQKQKSNPRLSESSKPFTNSKGIEEPKQVTSKKQNSI